MISTMASLLALISITSIFGWSSAASAADVLGLKLGMTEIEIVKELKSRTVTPLERAVISFNYDDGLNKFKTEEKLYSIATYTEGSRIALQFTYTGTDQRVVEIRRSYLNGSANPPTKELFERSLFEKYGRPADYSTDHGYKYVWAEKEKEVCWRRSGWSGKTNYEELYYPGLRREDILNSASKNKGYSLENFNIENCSSIVYVSYDSTDPVTNFDIIMTDFSTWIKDRNAINSMTANLTKEATRKRIEKSRAPEL